MPTQTEPPIVQHRRVEASTLATALEKKASPQVLFREVNEQIAKLGGDWSDPGMSLFLCECSNPACAAALEITPEEYEQVRADSTRFVVLTGHQQPDVERVVTGNDRYLVVEKFGVAGEVARSTDPRQHE